MRPVFAGAGAGIAVSLLVLALAEVLAAADDDPLKPSVRALLVTLILVGPVVAGAVVGLAGSIFRAMVAGAITLEAITILALARQVAADEDPMLSVPVAGLVFGALLGVVGAALRTRRADRTRR